MFYAIIINIKGDIMVFNEKYTKILELAAAQDEEFKAVLNQIIKQLRDDEKACVNRGQEFLTTHLIQNEGEPFLRGVEFGNYKREYGNDESDSLTLDESCLEINDYVTILEKQGQDKQLMFLRIMQFHLQKKKFH